MLDFSHGAGRSARAHKPPQFRRLVGPGSAGKQSVIRVANKERARNSTFFWIREKVTNDATERESLALSGRGAVQKQKANERHGGEA